MKKRRAPRLILAALLTLLGIWLIVFIAVCWCAGMERTPETADCILVLGCRVYPDGRLSLVLKNRVETALKAWQDGYAPVILVSGGRGGDEPVTEAEGMANALIQAGVPETCILLEDRSTDTRENIRYSKEIMENHGMNTALIVTSDYHLTRALWMARDAGLTARGLSAPVPYTFRAYWWGRIRESISWILYAFKII